MDFLEAKPQYVVMTKLGHQTFPREWYYRNPKNKEKYERFTRLILNQYDLAESYNSVAVYRRK